MNMIKVVLGISLLTSFGGYAQSTAGKTLIAKGNVKASANEQSRNLKRRSVIFDTDVITTGKNSKAQLRMTDGGMIALKQNTELQISDYRFSDENGQGSVVMELVKGGLRSVTGAIKAKNGNYNLKTPTGSIGIRGTHYEVEILDGNMFVAVWDGAVDLTVDVGNGTQTVSFGANENYSFGVVSEDGQVTQLSEVPENFNQGHSEDASEEEEEEEESSDQDDSSSEQQQNSQSTTDSSNDGDANTSEQIASDVGSLDDNAADIDAIAGGIQQVDNGIANIASEDFDAATTLSTEELLSQRTGSFEYANVESFQVDSSVSAISNFTMNMNIDFDNALITSGQMSFGDTGGEWFATFNGIINNAALDLDINFASHGNNLADGDINASFFDGLDSIVGEFDLHEINNPGTKVNGKFLLK